MQMHVKGCDAFAQLKLPGWRGVVCKERKGNAACGWCLHGMGLEAVH